MNKADNQWMQDFFKVHKEEPLAKVLKEKYLSFPRKWESSLFNMLQKLWFPVFTGMTTFARGSEECFDREKVALPQNLWL